MWGRSRPRKPAAVWGPQRLRHSESHAVLKSYTQMLWMGVRTAGRGMARTSQDLYAAAPNLHAAFMHRDLPWIEQRTHSSSVHDEAHSGNQIQRQREA